MGWDFTFSASFWIINVVYYSEWNESSWKEPKTIEEDDCGPANLISSGFALWLVLAPAVACVVQLPGSILFHGRSNFYRFAPEMGMADCLATLILLFKALRRGYGWTQSVLAVFLIREGIGEGDLWWREKPSDEPEAPPSYQEAVAESGYGTAAVAGAGAGVDTNNPDDVLRESSNVDRSIRRRLRRYSDPISLERMIGTALFLTIFIKIVAILAFTPAGTTALKVPSLLALSYSTSFLIFEFLVWSLALMNMRDSVENIPSANLVDLLRSIDPGDNPFTFPAPKALPSASSTTGGGEAAAASASAIELATQGHGGSGNGFSTQPLPYDKSVLLASIFVGMAGASIWGVILANVWDINKAYFFVLLSAVAIVFIRITLKTGARIARAPILQNLDAHPIWGGPARFISRLKKKARNRRTSGPGMFALYWLFERITAINIFSVGWVMTICAYFAVVFPGDLLDEEGNGLEKPTWLEWLG